MHLNCEGEGDGKYDEVERVNGRVNQDGTITYTREERHKETEPPGGWRSP